jgi:ribosomal RNA-processing protein 1
MQDKPAYQQALSRSFASLVPTLRTPVTLPFLRAFWQTVAREWQHIEALRLDKYLYLIRQYLNASFAFLSRNKWDPALLQQWNDIVEETPLETSDMKIPNGLRYHVLDVWVDEMAKVAGDFWEKEEHRDTLETLIQPVEKLAKGGKLKVLRTAAKECLADDRLRAWRGQEDEDLGEEVEEDDEEVEWGGIED